MINQVINDQVINKWLLNGYHYHLRMISGSEIQ